MCESESALFIVCCPCVELCDAFCVPRAGWCGRGQLLHRSAHHHRRLLPSGEETKDVVHLLPCHPHREVSALTLPLPAVAPLPLPSCWSDVPPSCPCSGLGYGVGAGMSGLAGILFENNNYTTTHPFNEPWRYAFRVRHTLPH